MLSFYVFLVMASSELRQRATPSPPSRRETVMEPFLQVLTSPQPADSLTAQAQMSRARFAVTQATSIFVALLTCLSLIIVALLKMNSIQEMFTDPCGIIYTIFSHLNITSPLLTASCNPKEDPAVPELHSMPEYG